MRKYILTIIVCLYATLLSSQTSSTWFQRLTYNDGLSDNKVNWILKSREGYLWIGTQLGLDRYDGFRVQSFYKIPGVKSSLPDNVINTIYEDGDGMLWVNTNSGLCIFNPATDLVNRDTEGWMKAHQMLGKPNVVAADAKGNLWIVSSIGRLYYYDFSKKKPTPIPLSKGVDLTRFSWFDISGNYAYLIMEDGCIMKTSNHGGPSLDTYIPETLGYKKSDFRIFADSQQGLWVWSELGFFHFNPKTKVWRPVKDIPMKDVFEDSQRHLYIATDHSGLLITDLDGNILQTIVNDPSDDRSLPDNTLQSVYVDDLGVLWIGMYRMGLAHYYRGQNQFGLLPFGDICTMTQSADGSLWLGTNDSGIRHYDFRTKRITTVGRQISKLASNIVVSSLATKDGSVWFGSYQGGLSRMKGGVATLYTLQNSGLANNNVWALAELSDGRIVIGTLGGGVQFLNPRTGKFTTLNTSNSKLPSDYIASIDVMKNGMIAIGHSQGVSLLKLSDYKFQNIDQSSLNGGSEISENAINQVFSDSRGLLWIATGAGLNVYDVANSKLYTVNLSNNRPHSDVSSICEDKKGVIWLSVGNEIKSINTKWSGEGWSFFSNTYDKADGVQSRLFNKRSVACLRDGRVLFGGIDGVNVINTNRLRNQLKNSRVIFSGLSIYDRLVNVGDTINGHVLLDAELNSDRKLSLGPDENTFTIHLASSTVGLPEEPRFLYRLRGENDDWLMTPPTDPSIQYVNLPSGHYTLEVKPLDSSGNPINEVATMKITVHPPFYLSIWALMIYAVLLAGIVFYLIWRVRKNRQEEMEKIEYKKEKEVDEAKMNFFTNIGYEFRSPLSLILAPLESMIKHEQDSTQLERMKLIQRSAYQLQTLTNQMLDFRRLMGNKEVVRMSQNDIVDVVKAICNQFAGLSSKSITLAFHTAKEYIYFSFDRDKVEKIVGNLLSNSYKFTPHGGRIDVSISLREGQWVDIKVADNGPGISDADKAHIFERFFRSKSKEDGGESGIGLNIVYEYAKMQGGSATVSDNPGGGTIFTVTLPFTKGHISGEGHVQVLTASGKENTGIAAPRIYAPDKKRDEETLAEAPEEKVESQGASKATVLIVDDNEDYLKFLNIEFSPYYNVRTAVNGKLALDSIREVKPDLVITDLMMPVMDGNTLCRNIKENKETANIPVIILTARTGAESEIESRKAGVDEYVKKPFNLRSLLRCINRLIAESRKAQS